MLIKHEREHGVLAKENNEIKQQIYQEVGRSLDISEERKKVVADFLFWIINPNHIQAPPDAIVKTRELVFSDPKLELAVNFVGSRLALQSEIFTDIFKGTAVSSPALPPKKIVMRIQTLYRKGVAASEIASQTPLSLLEVYALIRQLKRRGLVLPRTEQFGYARINELNLSVAIEWLNGFSQKQIMEKHNLKVGQLVRIINKLIEHGIVKRRRHALTRWEKKELDAKVADLTKEGESRRKIAKLLKTTDGIIHASLRRLQEEVKIPRKQTRFSENDWQKLIERIIPLRIERLTWGKIANQLKISQYRCQEVCKRLKGKT